MSNPPIEPERQAQLRRHALARLTGRIDASSPRANSAAALGVLYKLASSPATATDALALLHEIQVHQVEVQLQDEELRRSVAELEDDLVRHIRLYDLAPFAYLAVDARTSICESNLAAARLFGADRDALAGRRLDQLLAPESGAALRAMLEQARGGSPAQTRTLHLAAGGAAQALHGRVGADAASGRFLVAMLPAGAASSAAG